MIPQTPVLNHSNTLLEDSSDWVDDEGRSLIQYAKHNSVLKNQNDEKLKDNLVSFVSKKHPRQMAKMFVRTKIVPAFADYDDIFKRFRDAIAECENKKCDERAEGVEEILTKIGFHREGENMVINKLCRNCQ